MATLACLILFLNGADDRPCRSGEIAFLTAVQRGTLEILPDAGHLCSLQQPERFTRALRRFVHSLSTPRVPKIRSSVERCRTLHPPRYTLPYEPAHHMQDMSPGGASP